MSLRDRIGIDVGRRLRLEEALEWAAEHEVRWIDIQLDAGANALSSFDDARAAGAVPHGTLFTVAQDAQGTMLDPTTTGKSWVCRIE